MGAAVPGNACPGPIQVIVCRDDLKGTGMQLGIDALIIVPGLVLAVCHVVTLRRLRRSNGRVGSVSRNRAVWRWIIGEVLRGCVAIAAMAAITYASHVDTSPDAARDVARVFLVVGPPTWIAFTVVNAKWGYGLFDPDDRIGYLQP